jgi:hypothetical protein
MLLGSCPNNSQWVRPLAISLPTSSWYGVRTLAGEWPKYNQSNIHCNCQSAPVAAMWEWGRAWLGLSSFRKWVQCHGSASTYQSPPWLGHSQACWLPAVALCSTNPIPLLQHQGHISGHWVRYWRGESLFIWESGIQTISNQRPQAKSKNGHAF